MHRLSWTCGFSLVVMVACGGPDATRATASDASSGTATEAEGSTGVPTTTGDMTGAITTGGDPVCGNGVVEGDEACDDGNANEADGCSSTCQDPQCGNGVVEPGEGCDAGADNGAGNACTSGCQANICGDGQKGPGEGCDDGNTVDDDACTNDCALASCGDGVLNVGEGCDDGNAVDSDACLSTCVEAECGDGVLYAGQEACDDGPLNSDTAACTSACQAAQCGDGDVWTDVEQCDLGDANGPASACLDTCIDNVCGDGFEGPGEACDDGNLEAGDGCSPACSLESCGDGIVQPGETCDDGNADNSDACTDVCEPPACGDGHVQAGEACDLGADNSDAGACTLACATAACGDGLVHVGFEQCDHGAANADDAACKADCTDNVCGDGFPGPGEGCDDGNADDNDACTSVCHLASCGDGFAQPGEACDDGDAVDDDECTNACTTPSCGDHIVQAPEACDDGVDNGPGAVCTPDCTLATCGDGWLYGQEACDDGNANNGDACTDACEPATCGDGYEWVGVEECDDGNQIDTDACSNTCEDAVCSDSVVQAEAGEECDDGNLQSNDGCSPWCDWQWVLQVSAGEAHTCALLDTGAVRCWGSSLWGQLGYGNVLDIGRFQHPNAVGDVSVGGTVTQISAGGRHTCALLDTGAVRCWGHNLNGQIGQPGMFSLGDQFLPHTGGDVEVGGTVAQVSSGNEHTCVVLNTGAVRCWGSPLSGRLGYGNIVIIGDDEDPAVAGDVDVGGTVAEISAGFQHTCARLDTGAIRCWGEGFYGRLGYGNTDDIGDDEWPAAAGDVAIGGPAVSVRAGGRHTCALLDTGAVRCWGHNNFGQLGYGHTSNIGDDETPLSAGPPVALDGVAVAIDASEDHSCAVLDSGAVRCWGRGAGGRLGHADVVTIGDDEVPSAAGPVDVGLPTLDLDLGHRHTCVRVSQKAVRCWGEHLYGQLGLGQMVNFVGDDEHPSTKPNVRVF